MAARVVPVLVAMALSACAGVAAGGADAGGTDASSDDARVATDLVARFSTSRVDALTHRFDASASTGEIVSYRWSFGDGVEAIGVEVSHRFAEAGCHRVVLTVVDGTGHRSTHAADVAVVGETVEEPAAILSALPRDGAVLPRDVATNEARLQVSGTLGGAGWEEVRAHIVREGEEERVVSAPVCGSSFELDVPIVAELARRDVELFVATASEERSIGVVHDLVAGDVIVIEGQSNAVAGWMARPGHAMANREMTPFVRSFGMRTIDPALSLTSDRWLPAEGDRGDGEAAIGQWALHMGARLVARTGIPLAIVSGARGGMPIGFFQRDYRDPDDPDRTNNYEQLLERMQRGGLASSVRAILYYQGEGDGGDVEAHRAGFTALHQAWREDYPGVERFYVMQIRSGCGAPPAEFLDMQRRFAETLPSTAVMSTTGLDGHDGCHFYYDGGYRELGEHLASLLARDLFDEDAIDVEAIDVTRATLAADVISIETRSDATGLVVDPGVAADFAVDGGRDVLEVRAVGSRLELMLSPGGRVSRVSYAGHAGPQGAPWVTNPAGVGLLAFVLSVE